MDLSRRQFLQLSTSAGAGTAVGTLVGLGVNLTPATTRAQRLRIQDAKVTPECLPLLLRGMRHARAYDRWHNR